MDITNPPEFKPGLNQPVERRVAVSVRTRRVVLMVAGVLVLGGGIVAWQLGTASKPSPKVLQSLPTRNALPATQNPLSYSLHIQNALDSAPILPGAISTLKFDIRARDGRVFKDFDRQQPYSLALIVARKDRSNFQHIHPKYDASTGTFTVSDFKIAADGPYRLFAAYAADNARADSRGSKEIVAPYVDITVGDMGRYTAQAMGVEKLTSNVDGYLMRMFSMSSEQVKQPATRFSTGSSQIVGISLTKDGALVADLENFRGSLARMVALGPNLEMVSVNAIPSDLSKPADPIVFHLTIPASGDYRFFVQVEADEDMETFDFEAPVHG